jgi:methylated-DNA-[protein]-cysteine S-methyltransferase
MKTGETSSAAFYHSPAGIIIVKEKDGFVTETGFIDEEVSLQTGTPSAVLHNALHQLHEYFQGSRKIFDLPLKPAGTVFQQTVWNKLLEIPFGETVTYMHMAIRLGDKKVIRAAASANGKNPIGIIIPCHRVIGEDGKLTGYAGGLHRKQWLLEHEARFGGKKPLLF